MRPALARCKMLCTCNMGNMYSTTVLRQVQRFLQMNACSRTKHVLEKAAPFSSSKSWLC